MKKSKIPTLLGIFILILGLAAGIFLIQNQQIFRLGASPETSPKDVRITNITSSSFTVSWTTDEETSGFIKWGEPSNSLDGTELDEITESSKTHTATIQGLNSNKTYYFKINSDGRNFDNNGVPWQKTTGPELPGSTTIDSISGTVLTSTGSPAGNAIVYATLAGASTLSTTTSQSGSWIIPISLARTQDLTSFIEVDDTNTLIEISVQAASQGVATAQIYPAAASPVPPIVLGQSHDFRNLRPGEADGVPKANINLPEEASPSSGFEVPEEIATPSAETITLDSLDEGEIVTSTEPEFFGEGPPGTTITITIESDPITDEVYIGSSGDWDWSPPEDLSEGSHVITISWRDAGGILRTLTRTFVVQAAEGPAFESTPSATPTASPTPTPSPSPTASPTATPASTPTSTPSAVEDSGTLTPTILLSIMGIGFLVFSILIYQYARRE